MSRRKRDVAKAEAEPRVDVRPAGEETEVDAVQKAEPEFDIASLPPIDSINALTDVTAFLRDGVPAALTRAALRRVWTADPAIRDFVGLAENAWDFTDPNAMPGFGALESTPEQIGAMLERVIGGARETAEKLAELPDNEQAQQKSDPKPAVSASTEALPEPTASVQSPPAQSEEVAAVQPEASEDDGDVMPVRRRTHGGALPI